MEEPQRSGDAAQEGISILRSKAHTHHLSVSPEGQTLGGNDGLIEDSTEKAMIPAEGKN